MRDNIGVIYIKIGFLWLLASMLFGLWSGIAESLQFSTAYAHANLVGFVPSVLIGLVFIAFPEIANSKLAIPQLLIYQLGAIGLVAGKLAVASESVNMMLVVGSSFAIIFGASLFIWILTEIHTSVRQTIETAQIRY